MRVRAISGWAAAAMAAIGAFAVLYLADSLLPLAEAWSAGHGGAHLDAIRVSEAAITACCLAAFTVAAVSFMTWLAFARANLAAFFGARPNTDRRFAVVAWFIPMANLVLPAAVVVDVAVHSGELGAHAWRRRMARLVWAWWACFVAALLAVVGGLLAVAGNAVELTGLRADLAAGTVSDTALTGDLLAGLVASRLPAAALFVLAAALAMVVISRTTSAHYERIEHLRKAVPVPAEQHPPVHKTLATAAAPVPGHGGNIDP